jgi:triphosphoribosyl-dephospho-CoA synthase
MSGPASMRTTHQLTYRSTLDRRLRAIARAAVASLHDELVLAPKPGLVCPDDRGSHDDMDATTMLRSLFALRHGFRAMVEAAAHEASFAELQRIGIEAERVMRIATSDVNTHRGAIFSLGLIASAAADCVANGLAITPMLLREVLRARWGRALLMAPVVETTHGRGMAARHGAGGARREAADGFPTVFEIVLPALHEARRAGIDERGARLHALMSAIAHAEDTNLLYRGGVDGLRHAQAAARDFLVASGAARDDRDEVLRAIGRGFVALRLSPGGSADLLAATLFVDRICAIAR